jgi:tetratricopeptide (TPR) repeat protein
MLEITRFRMAQEISWLMVVAMLSAATLAYAAQVDTSSASTSATVTAKSPPDTAPKPPPNNADNSAQSKAIGTKSPDVPAASSDSTSQTLSDAVPKGPTAPPRKTNDSPLKEEAVKLLILDEKMKAQIEIHKLEIALFELKSTWEFWSRVALAFGSLVMFGLAFIGIKEWHDFKGFRDQAKSHSQDAFMALEEIRSVSDVVVNKAHPHVLLLDAKSALATPAEATKALAQILDLHLRAVEARNQITTKKWYHRKRTQVKILRPLLVPELIECAHVAFRQAKSIALALGFLDNALKELEYLTIEDAEVEDAKVEDAKVEGAVVEGAVVEGAVVEGAVVEGAVVEDAEPDAEDLRLQILALRAEMSPDVSDSGDTGALRRLLNKHRREISCISRFGIYHLQRGNPGAVIRAFKNEEVLDCPAKHSLLARAYELRGDIDEAKNHHNRATTNPIGDPNPEYFYQYAKFLARRAFMDRFTNEGNPFDKTRIGNIKKHFRAALMLQQNRVDTWAEYIETLHNLGDDDGASVEVASLSMYIGDKPDLKIRVDQLNGLLASRHVQSTSTPVQQEVIA